MTITPEDMKRLAELEIMVRETIEEHFPEDDYLVQKNGAPHVESKAYPRWEGGHTNLVVLWYLPSRNALRIVDYYGVRYYDHIPENTKEKLRKYVLETIETTRTWWNPEYDN